VISILLIRLERTDQRSAILSSHTRITQPSDDSASQPKRRAGFRLNSPQLWAISRMSPSRPDEPGPTSRLA
jgi:hypothetical protein